MFKYYFNLITGRGGGVDQELDELLELQQVIPGVPGQDYPIYSEVPPELEFSCEDKVQ